MDDLSQCTHCAAGYDLPYISRDVFPKGSTAVRQDIYSNSMFAEHFGIWHCFVRSLSHLIHPIPVRGLTTLATCQVGRPCNSMGKAFIVCVSHQGSKTARPPLRTKITYGHWGRCSVGGVATLTFVAGAHPMQNEIEYYYVVRGVRVGRPAAAEL